MRITHRDATGTVIEIERARVPDRAAADDVAPELLGAGAIIDPTDAQVRAIEAVATLLAAAQFTLFGTGTATASAALYAAQQPGRVRELVCVSPAFPIVRHRRSDP